MCKDVSQEKKSQAKSPCVHVFNRPDSRHSKTKQPTNQALSKQAKNSNVTTVVKQANNRRVLTCLVLLSSRRILEQEASALFSHQA